LTTDSEALSHEVRLYVFGEAAATGRVPQPPQIATAIGRSEAEIREALKRLATAKVLILAPNDGNIWAASPFCAVQSGFRVAAAGKSYIDRWCRTYDLPRGATLTPAQGWRLARGWYENTLKPDWRRHTLEETETLLASVELTGLFWDVRGD